MPERFTVDGLDESLRPVRHVVEWEPLRVEPMLVRWAWRLVRCWTRLRGR